MATTNLSNFLNGSYEGFTGSRGFTGSQGDTGFIGSRGDTGFTGSRGSLNWSVKTANYTAVNLDAIIADTSGGSFTITLPASPSTGDLVKIATIDANINSLTLNGNSNTFEGLSQTLIIDLDDVTLEIIYDGSTWQVYANIGPTGFVGSQGFTGSIGFTGSQGSQGIIGFTGSAGDSADVSITDDTATDETRFVTFVDQTTGDVSGFGVSSTKLFFNPSSGELNATSFNALSDVTFKENVSSIENAINTIEKLRGTSFTWKETQQESYGVIAQEIERVLPGLVSNSNFKSVNYNAIIPFLIEAIKELNDEVKQLRNEMKK